MSEHLHRLATKAITAAAHELGELSKGLAWTSALSPAEARAYVETAAGVIDYARGQLEHLLPAERKRVEVLACEGCE